MDNSANVVIHNVYFEGKVQSLGLETEKGKATLGVMKKGAYQFSTSTPEKMIVISGSMKVKLHNGEWNTYSAQEEFNLETGIKFDVVCDNDAAYICYYG